MLKIRTYQPADRKQCRDLWKELTVWHRKIYQDPTIGGEHPEHYFDEHLAKVGPERLWVAAYDSQVVGFIGLVVEEVEAEIEPLIVSENYRYKGIGMQLLRIAISEARTLGVKFLKVKPVARNVQAIKFFYNQGFKSLGHIDMFLDFCDYKWKQGPKLFECEFNF